MTPTKVYISRNFTEFGPFTQEEIVDFSKRSIIGKRDFVRVHNSDTWIHADEWVSKASSSKAKAGSDGEAAPAPKAAAPAKKAAKKAPAKKAAK